MNLLVITPTLGTSPWLEETMASVAELGLECRHVLVASEAAMAELRLRFPRATVVAEPPGKRGMYAAINAGLTAVTDWDAVTYINDDDRLLPGFAAVAAELARGSGPRVVYGRVKLIDERGHRLGAIPVSPDPALNRALYAERLEPVFQHGTLISRAAMNQLGGFDEMLRFCGDSELLARACVAGIPFTRVGGGPVAAFRLRAGQLTKNRASMNAERAQVDLKLALLGPERHRWARFRFRLANLPVYAERILRHGWMSFDEQLVQPDANR